MTKKFGYQQDDRVQHIESGKIGTVYQTQMTSIVSVVWDGEPNVVRGISYNKLRTAPWHGLKNPVEFPDPVHLRNFHAANLISIDIDSIVKDYGKLDDDVEFTDAGSVNADKPFTYKKGDRVKLKYNRNTGTVYSDQLADATILQVIWDKAPGIAAVEEAADLVTLHAPRDTDPVNPNQEAIDAIEKQRAVLKKEIEDLQSRLGTLTQAKRLLERG